MKIVTIAISILTFINIFPFIDKETPLLEMVQVADDQNISITSWKIYIQDHISYAHSKEETEQQIKQLKKSAKEYTFQHDDETEGHLRKLIGNKTINTYSVQESVLITIYEEEGTYRISQSYEIEGNEWSKDSWEYVKETYKKELKKSKKVFYSLYGTKAINKLNSLEKEAYQLLAEFKAEKIEEMKEQEFISLSAYRSDWEMKIPTEGEKALNLQMGLRIDTKRNVIDIAIGTPIITSGY